MPDTQSRLKIPALKVKQWLKEWENVKYSKEENRDKPLPHFYLFSLSAKTLKKISGIYRRTTTSGQPRKNDLGIQRRHDPKRSDEIKDFIPYGYPWSDLQANKRNSDEYTDLKKPGWLPTSIVINILKPADSRLGEKVDQNDLIDIEENDGINKILLPKSFRDSNWAPSNIYPIEVIDGQHRLWAFENSIIDGDFELPVVAFHGLDISWQAYLFWTINIKPKRINASLAFDLYPLLRTEDWLNKFEGHPIYREARAQELTEYLWGYPQSAWYQRINMLGEPGVKGATQAAWIRSLTATFIKRYEGKNIKIGGLYGSKMDQHSTVLPWTKHQQAALLILIGQILKKTIKKTSHTWASELRKNKNQDSLFGEDNDDAAFLGQHTLLNTDQGIRAILHIFNDFLFEKADDLKLKTLTVELSDSNNVASDESNIDKCISELSKTPISSFITNLSDKLASYDWRSSSAPGLTEEQRTNKLAFRGSGGYLELRRQVLKHIGTSQDDIGQLAISILEKT